jgi:hypothetical protein
MQAVEDARLLSLIEQTHAKTDPDRYTYVDLASGRELSSDTHERLSSSPTASSSSSATPTPLSPATLPRTPQRRGHRPRHSSTHDRTTCDHVHGLIACFDSTGHPGLWQYR